MSGDTQTSTSSSTPPANFLTAYNALMGQAAGVANQPLQQYSGNIVAGLSPEQQSAIGIIQNSQGVANPFINSAAQAFGSAMTPLSTDAQGIASGASAGANGIAGNAGTAAQGAAAQGVGIAQQGAIGNAATANQAAGTNVWNQVGPVTSGQIQNYESPYTQQVVDATQAQFNNQNQQTNQGIVGNAISKGAWGGDRAGVAQGIAAGQEALAQAPVIAGLQNQGYSQALSEANTQQALQANLGQSQASLAANTALGAGNLLSSTGTATGQLGANTALGAGQLGANTALGAGNLGIAGSGQQLQADQATNWLAQSAGQGIAGLGNEAQTDALAGAQAQMGAGNLEQSVDQAQLNVPYQQFLQQQQYPFQSTQWLTSLIQGLGSSAGGSSTTTSPGPSGISQAIGGAGALASLGALFLKHGGIVKRASGGNVPDLSLQFIPDYKSGIAQGGGPPKPPSPKEEQDDDFSGVDGLVSGISKFKNRHGGAGGLPTTGDISAAFSGQFGADDPSSFAPAGWSGGAGTDAGMLASAGFARGGIARRASGGSSSAPDPIFGADGPPINFGKSIKGGNGIAIPQITSAHPPEQPIPENLKHDYGNAASDSQGHSTLPSTTYYPNVDPWFSENPGNKTTAPSTTKNGVTTPGAPTLKPGITDPTNSTVGGGGPDYSNIMSLIFPGGFPYARGGGIARRAAGGPMDDDDYVPSDAMDDGDAAPSMGIVSRGALPRPADIDVTGGKPFTTHPIEKQPAGNDLPPPPEASGIAAKPDHATYTPRKAVDVADQPEGKDAGKLALLAASLGILAGKSPHAGQNIGAGGLEGLKEYTTLKGKAADRAEKQAEAEDTGNYRVASLSDAMDRWQGTLQETKDFHEQTGKHQTNQDLEAQSRDAEAAKYHQGMLDNSSAGKWTPGGVDGQGNVVAINDKTGEKKVFDGMKPKPTAGSQSSLSPATLHDLVVRGIAGEPVTTYIGNSPGNKAAFLNALSEYSAANNIDPKSITAAIVGLAADKAGAKSLAMNLAKTESSVVEADKFADNALALSAKVNRGRFIPVNAALQAWEKNTGDPAVIQFGFANNSLINAYATAVAKGGQKTDSDTQEARHLLSIAQSPEQYAAAIKTLKMETHAAQAAPEVVRERMQARIAGKNPFAATTDMDAIGGPADAGGGNTGTTPPSPASIQYLKSNPGTASQFDAHFGKDASKQYLGGQ